MARTLQRRVVCRKAPNPGSKPSDWVYMVERSDGGKFRVDHADVKELLPGPSGPGTEGWRFAGVTGWSKLERRELEPGDVDYQLQCSVYYEQASPAVVDVELGRDNDDPDPEPESQLDERQQREYREKVNELDRRKRAENELSNLGYSDPAGYYNDWDP